MSLRIFVVEDSPRLRDNLAATLKELAGVEVVGTAETEHEGRRWLAGHADGWDIAIVDLFLREGSGLNLLDAFGRRTAGQKVVVLSNHSSPDVRWRCEQLGADAVFDKSHEIDALVRFCTDQLDRGTPAVTDPQVPLPAATASQQTDAGLHA
jgi:two-component system OmpR family response regulator